MAGKKEDDPVGEAVRVTRGMPDVTVRVMAGVTMNHEGTEYKEGDEFELSGPMAESFAFDGAVEII